MSITLFAANDWVGAVITLVVFIIWGINRLLTAAKAVTPPARNPQRRVPEGERPLAPPRPPVAPEPKGSQAQLNAEIEEFLKRANQRRERGKQAPPKAPEVPLDVQPISRRDRSSVA